MSVKVLLPNAFHKHTNGEREIQSEAANLPALVVDIETHFPALKQHLRDGDGKVRQFINFYVNDEDIRFLGNDKYASLSRRTAADACACCSYCGQEECSCG